MAVTRADLVAEPLAGYRLLDSGGGRKLEEVAGRLIDRPSAAALWPPRSGAVRWRAAESVCERHRDGAGSWRHRGGEPRNLALTWQGPVGPGCCFALRLTGFGHCGIFPEQAPVWSWAQERIAHLAARLGRPPRVANCFAYTGGGSLAAAAAGAEVFHVDSAKGVLAWGREHRLLGASAGRVRWIHDDVRAFAAFGQRRGFRYDLVFLDPPAWGHGPGKEQWQLEEDLTSLLGALVDLLEPGHGAIHCTCHTPGVQSWALVNALQALSPWAEVVHGDMAIAHVEDERLLPAGVYAWAGREANG